MMAPENKFRMLAVPRNNLLGINRNSHVSREVSEEYFRKCEAVGNGPRFCPSKPIQLTETVDTCLTALYGNEMAIVAETCPVLHLNQSQPYVVALSPRHFSVYLPEENTARVTCGEDFLGSMTMPAGLSEVTVDPLCKVVTPHLVVEPKFGMEHHEVRFDRIKLNLTTLESFAEPMAWAVGNQKVATDPSEVGPSLKDIEST